MRLCRTFVGFIIKIKKGISEKKEREREKKKKE